MPLYTKDAGYGRMVGNAALNPTLSGKVFIVGKSALPNGSMIRQLFSPDSDGVVRYAATIDAAIGLCTAGAGDIIYVLPGHTETVTATSIAHDVSSVSIIGLGRGSVRPTLTFSTAAATITVTAPNGRWSNFIMIANFADVAAAFTLGATSTDFQFDNCEFRETGTDLNWFNIVVTGSTANASDGLTVLNNKAFMSDAAAKSFISILGTNARLTANDNIVINGRTTDTAIFLTMSSLACTLVTILRNYVVDIGGSTGNAAGQFLTGSSTACSGIVGYNTLNSLNTTSALLATAGTKLSYQENYVSGAADKQGTLHPAADNPA